MRDFVWLDIETQIISGQPAECRDNELPIIPIVTEISAASSASPNGNSGAIRNIDVFNLQYELIDRLRVHISSSRIALDQWIGFDQPCDSDADSPLIRLYMRSLLTAPEIPHLDRTARVLTHQVGHRLSIGHELGEEIDFYFQRGMPRS